MSYLGQKYRWDAGFFDEIFFDVLMKSWYKSEEEWFCVLGFFFFHL